MYQRIGGRPAAKFTDYFGRTGRNQAQFPFNYNRRLFCFSARYALAAGIQALGLKSGDKVLLPGYNCGVEIEPFLFAGLQTEFYRINTDLQPDLDDVRRRLKENVKAVLVTHFFGFPQPIEEIRRLSSEAGAYIIEDCAHALLSSCDGEPLGTSGDIAVFSILKTLPVPNGGVLVLNNNTLRWVPEQSAPSRFSAAYYMADLYRQKTLSRNRLATVVDGSVGMAVFNGMNLVKLCIAAAKKIINRGGGCLVRPDSIEFRGQLIGWGMSSVSERIISAADLEQIKEKRRNNFSKYLNHFRSEHFASMTLPITELSEGVNPLFFPLLFVEESKREIVYQKLKDRGITTHIWWDWFHPAVPWNDYPDAVYLKKHLFGLPVHQDLDSALIDRILLELDELL